MGYSLSRTSRIESEKMPILDLKLRKDKFIKFLQIDDIFWAKNREKIKAEIRKFCYFLELKYFRCKFILESFQFLDTSKVSCSKLVHIEVVLVIELMHRNHNIQAKSLTQSLKSLISEKSPIRIYANKYPLIPNICKEFPKKWCREWLSSRQDNISSPRCIENIYNIYILLKPDILSQISSFKRIVIIIKTIVTKKIALTRDRKNNSERDTVIKLFILKKEKILLLMFCEKKDYFSLKKRIV